MSSLGYAPFDGDGRVKHLPEWALPGTLSMIVTNAQARDAIDRFNTSGKSTHGPDGCTLWVIIEWAQWNRIAYNLNAMPGLGYCISRTGVVV